MRLLNCEQQMELVWLRFDLEYHSSTRSASVAASASVWSMADEEDEVDSDSNDETARIDVNDIADSSLLCKDDDETQHGKGRKRAAPRGRGRGSTTSKRGKAFDNSSSSLHRLLSSRDDEDDMGKKSQPRVTRNHGASRR